MLTPELRTLRDSQDRVLEREGIPMVLALVDERGRAPAAVSPQVVAEGQRLAAELDRLRAALSPALRDDDNGGLISVLQAVAYADFGAPGHRLPDEAVALPRHEPAR
jgi:hypothetical protein